MNLEQLKTILWLRWRLTRNQWTRSQGVGVVITVIVAVAIFVLAVASFLGGLAGGIFGLSAAKPSVIMGVWLGLTLAFLFLWTIGLINEIQRSESIDLQRLMHLPVGLGQMFVINYVASHVTISTVLAVPAMLGLTVGLSVSHGPAMLLLAPLAISMVIMVSAWTYQLRGWLAALMSNPRKRRTVIMGITFAFVLLSQAPNLYFNVFRSRNHSHLQKVSSRQKLDQLIAVQKYIPPLWVPVGAAALAEGDVLPAVLGTVGCLAIGAAGLRRAYRDTLRFYLGDPGKKHTISARVRHAPAPAVSAGATGASRFLELRLPGVPEQSAALALATFRSMLRAPEIKMAWASSFIVPLIIGVSFLLRGPAKIPDAPKPFFATAAIVFSVFMLVQFLSNQFGFDRDGFRALILSPADRRLVLIGKNLASLPVAAVFGLVLLALICVLLRPPILVVAATLVQIPCVVLIAGLVGNLLSIVVPYKIQPGSMKPTKMPALAMLVMVLCNLLFPAVMAPVFVAPLAELLWRKAGWPEAVPINLLFSAALLGLMAVVYWQMLFPLGRLLQRREKKILTIVTAQVE